YSHNELVLEETKFKILLESTFGASSSNYQEMLDLELINTGFNYNVYLDNYCGYIKVQANTNKPEEFKEYVKTKLLGLSKSNIDSDDFSKMKKALLGSYIKAFNNVEFIAHGIIDYKFRDGNLFTSLDLINNLQIKDLKPLRKYFVNKA